MKRNLILYTLIIYIISFLNSNGQEASVKIEKLNYKLDEEITLVFVVNKKFDSISKVDFSDFRILENPIESSGSTTINNQNQFEHKLTCKISSKSFGTFTIIPPKYYFGNNEVTSDKIIITVENNKLTDDENKAIVLKKMSTKLFKPEGTIRYTIIDGHGYIEEFRDKNWIFIRILTEKEIKRLKKK